MANTFHPFSRLPTELRNRIWKAAVWDRSVSSANFFTILPAGGTYLASSPRVRLGPPTRTGNVCNCRSHVGSWEEPNMGSGCMVDSGLWEACHESRAMMKRTYPTPQWYNGETATGLATDQRGVTLRYTFVPSRDVLVISLLNFLHAFIDPDREIDCVYDVPPARNNSAVSPFSVQSPPIFGARGKYPRRLKLSDMRHIAVSLDVDWELDDVDWQPEDVEIRKAATLVLFAQMTVLLNPYTSVYLYWSNMGHAGIAGAIGDKGARFHTENGYFGPFQRL